MKIAVDIDDTLNVVDRVGTAGAYIARKNLPFHIADANSNMFVKVYDWRLPDVLEFIKNGGVAAFTEAPARRGAREVLGSLREAGHEVVILTSRPKSWFINPEKISRDWLEKRRIPYDELVAECDDKGAYCLEHGIGAIVDDSLETCLRAQELGVSAVLAVGKHNIARAHEVRYAGADWRQIASALAHIISLQVS